MTADIIPMPERKGNGAREALVEIGKNCPFHVQEDVASCWADDVLLRLAARGFMVVPMEPDEPYVPTENTVSLSMEDWRKLNRGEPKE